MPIRNHESRVKRSNLLLWILVLIAWAGIPFFAILVDQLESPTTPYDLYSFEVKVANREYDKIFEAESLAEAREQLGNLLQSPLFSDGGFLKNPPTQLHALEKLGWDLYVLELRVKAGYSGISLEPNIFKLAPKGFQIITEEEGLDISKHLKLPPRDSWIAEGDLKFRDSDQARILAKNQALERQESSYVNSLFLSLLLAILLSIGITFRSA